jgi:hypothetical protein
MIKLNITEKKEIKFDVNVSGVDVRDLRGSIRLQIEGVEYGFPARVVDGTVMVEIPPLDEFVKQSLHDGQTINAKLEIIAADTYLLPWEDTMMVETPPKVEATISEVKSVKEEKKPVIKVSKVTQMAKKLTEKKTEPVVKKEKKVSSKFRNSLEKK